MVKYNEHTDSFSYKGKPLNPKDKSFLHHVCSYVIDKISAGESIADVFPVESSNAPTLAKIFDFIDNDKKLAEEYTKAESTRLRITKEKLMQVMDVYRQDPSNDNKELCAAIQRSYDSLRKAQEESGNVILNHYSALPPGFWDVREVVAPDDNDGKDI